MSEYTLVNLTSQKLCMDDIELYAGASKSVSVLSETMMSAEINGQIRIFYPDVDTDVLFESISDAIVDDAVAVTPAIIPDIV